MTIQEAFATGKPLARENKYSHRGSNMDGYVHPQYLLTGIQLTIEDIIATDWVVQVQEEKFTFTRSEMFTLLINFMHRNFTIDELIQEVKKGTFK